MRCQVEKNSGGGKRAEVEKYRAVWRDCGRGLSAVFMKHPRVLSYWKVVQELLKATFGFPGWDCLKILQGGSCPL